MNTNMINNRNLEIDTLRGLACILLVTYHVIGSNTSSGLQVSEGLLREINDSLAYLRMPLFTFLSGVVYAYRPFRENATRFIKDKGRRLLIPMLTVGTIFALLRHGIAGTSFSDPYWHTLHIYPVAHFWFVEAILLIFLLIVVLEKLKLLKSLPISLMILIASSTAYTIGTDIKIFAFDGFIYLLPFFLLGNIVQRFDFRNKIPYSLSIAALTFGFISISMISLDMLTATPRFTLLSLITGSLLCIGLISCKIKLRYLARIGSYSYSIYIFHVFFTASTRMALENTPLNSTPYLLTFGLLAGIFGPIIIEISIKNTALLNTLLIGKKYVSS